MLGGVGDGEDIAERIIGAIDLIEATHSSGTPDVDNWLAGTGNEQRPIIGEEEAHDTALVGLDSVDWLEVVKRPDEYLAVLCTGVYAVVADDEAENRAVMLEGVGELRSRVRRDFDDGQWCRGGWHRRHVACELCVAC